MKATALGCRIAVNLPARTLSGAARTATKDCLSRPEALGTRSLFHSGPFSGLNGRVKPVSQSQTGLYQLHSQRISRLSPIMSSPARTTRRSASKSSESPAPPSSASTPQPPQPEKGPKDPHDLTRFSTEWWKEWAIIFTVFAITGSSSVKVTRPVVGFIAGEGTFFGGPWYYTVVYLLCTFPICRC